MISDVSLCNVQPPLATDTDVHTHTHTTGVTKALRNMNKRLNLPQLQKIMMQFERESEIMDLKEETISDTIDDVLGEGDEEEVGHVTLGGGTAKDAHVHVCVISKRTISTL